MKTFHYIQVDDHNPSKGHHITITPDGKCFYNQAIYTENSKNREYLEKSKDSVPGHFGWVDFYPENEEVTPNKKGGMGAGAHGYQQHIDAAYRKWLKTDQPLEVGEQFDFFMNQADREMEVLAVTEDEALCWYEMPAGRKFLAVFARQGECWDEGSGYRKHLRSQSVKSLPMKWKRQLQDGDLLWIHREIG
jgi:hypothetical protein